MKTVIFGKIKSYAATLVAENFYFLKPSAIVIPGAIVTVFSIDALKDFVCRSVPPNLCEWITTSEPHILIFSVVVTFFGSMKWPSFVNKEADALEALLKSLNIPAVYRGNVFGKCLRKIENNHGERFNCDKFVELVNPAGHIIKYMEGVTSFIFDGFKKSIANDQSLKVVLFRFRNGTIANKDDWFYYPDGAAPTINGDEIMSDETPARRSFKKDTITYISDINKPEDGLKFVNPSNDEKKGSIVCFPISFIHLDREVVAVLSVFTNTPNFFTKYRVSILSIFIQPYIERIRADLYLLILREKAYERS